MTTETRKSSITDYWPHVVLVVLLAVFVIGDLRRVPRNQAADFRHFYWAGQAMAEGKDLYTSGEGGYIYPPLVAMLYAPLTLLSFNQAAYVMLFVNTITLWIALVILAREMVDRYALDKSVMLVGLVAMIGALCNEDKIKGELQMWQTNSLIFFCLVIGLRFLDRMPLVAGLALGAALNIKYQTIGVFAYLLLRRRNRAAMWMIVGTVFWALLPALVSGWHQNLRDWSYALAGVLDLLGIKKVDVRAHIEASDSRISYSITSGLLRLGNENGLPWLAPVVLSLTVLITLIVATIAYRRAKIPLWLWPREAEQMRSPYRALVAMEFAVLISLTLVYSPQTNSRHLLLACLCTFFATAILFARSSWSVRIWTIVALLILIAGFVLPTGSRDLLSRSWRAHFLWRNWGGPCWTLWIATLMLVWAALKHASGRDNASDAGAAPHP